MTINTLIRGQTLYALGACGSIFPVDVPYSAFFRKVRLSLWLALPCASLIWRLLLGGVIG